MRKLTTKKGSSSGISTIISLSLVLFVVGLLAFILINANKVSNKMRESIVFTIMLQDNSDEIKAEFESYLTSSNYFKEVLYTDKETAYTNLKKDLGEDFSSVLENNPLFDAYDAYVNAKFVTTQGLTEIESFIHEFGGGSIVQDIFYQKNLVEKLNDNVRKISLFLLAFCVVFFLISFALINNTIRLAIYSKRLLIRTMRLVGATNMFIQKPYLISSLYQGFFSSILAIFMIIVSLEILKPLIHYFLPGTILSETNDFIEIAYIFGLLLIFGIIISWISTFFAVRRYLNLNENELYN